MLNFQRNISIARLELVGGQLAAKRISYIFCHRLAWKAFVSNRAKKITEITKETGILWKYCLTKRNFEELGRGTTIDKVERGDWFIRQGWLLDEEEWPIQPKLILTRKEAKRSK